MADAPQISFALLADAPNRNDRTAESKSRFFCGAQGPNQRNDSRSVVGNPRHKQHLRFTPEMERRRSRKNSIEVSVNNDRIAAGSFVGCEDIARRIDARMKPQRPYFL